MRLRRNFVPVDIRAKTEVSEKCLKDLQMQARAHGVDFDFMMARVLEIGIINWHKLTPPEAELMLDTAKKVLSSSLLLGDSQPFNERRIN